MNYLWRPLGSSIAYFSRLLSSEHRASQHHGGQERPLLLLQSSATTVEQELDGSVGVRLIISFSKHGGEVVQS